MRVLFLLPLCLLGSRAPRPARILLPGYFSCQSALLEESGHALACYAKTQQQCRNGHLVLSFEKRVPARTARIQWAIVDTVHITTAGPGCALTISYCASPTGKPRQYFVLYKWASADKRYLSEPRRAWGVNAQDHLVEVPVKNLRCLNNDYGAD